MSPKQSASPEHAHASAQPRGNGRITRPPVIVVGMHRSGTSFVASLLHAAGLDMGSRLMPAARSNERGHFENMDFVEFHMRELRLTGHDDSGWATLQTLTLSEEAAAEARDIIETNARTSAWGWKDPRTTFFLDFWSSLLPNANFVFIYREPSEVIESLYRRGDEPIQLSPELAARAYITHNEMMLKHAREHRAQSIIANVAAVARDPKRFLSTLSEKLGIDLNVDAPSTFEGELMHSIASDEPHATLLRHIVPEIDRLYASLEREADVPSSASERKRPTARKVKGAFFHDWVLETKRSAELRQRNADLSQREGEVERLQSELNQRNADLSSFQEELRLRDAESSRRTAELTAELERERAREAELQDLVQQREAELQAIQTTLAETHRHHALESESYQTELQALRSERDRALDELAQLRDTISNLERRLEQTNGELVAQTEALIAATRAESDKIAFLIANVQSGSFWKLKRGINRVFRYLRI